MKKIATLLFLLTAGIIVLAQSPTNKINLVKSQELKFSSTIKANISQEMMGQTMETIMDVSNKKSITVKDADLLKYQLESKTTHLKMNLSMMGQDKAFDSDNKDDMTGEMKEMGKDINVAKPLILTTEGKCKPDEKNSPEKKEQDANPMAGMMQQMMGGGTEEITTAACFMLVPLDKKQGDSWTETIGDGTTKTIWNYTWDSTLTNIAVIKATAKETNNSTVNAMGMDMTINMTNDITEIRKVDLTSGVVIYNSSTKKINGTIDIMGQSVPMSGTAITTVTAE